MLEGRIKTVTVRKTKTNNRKEHIALSERIYTCEACGLSLSRDYNASLNIKNEAIRMIAGEGNIIVRCGDTVRPEQAIALASA